MQKHSVLFRYRLRNTLTGGKKMSVLHINEATFEQEVLHSDKPVLLDFFASWCGPCSQLSPIIDQFAANNPQFKVAKINVDEQRGLAKKHKVFSIPTLVVYKNGEITKRATGVHSEEELLNLI